MGAAFGAASAFLASLVGDEVTAGGNIPWTMQEVAAGASVGQRIGSTIGAGADALLSEGNSQAGGGNQSTQGQTLANSRAAHDAASNEIANGFTEQGALVQKEVTLDSTSAAGATVRARADQVVTGTPNGTLQVPNGYYATDLNNNVITQIPLNSSGQVIIEVKTGTGDTLRRIKV